MLISADFDISETRYFWDPTIMRPDISETRHFWDPMFLRKDIYETQYFWDPIFLRSNISETRYEIKYFWDLIFLRSDISETQYFWDPIFLMPNISDYFRLFETISDLFVTFLMDIFGFLFWKHKIYSWSRSFEHFLLLLKNLRYLYLVPIW